MNAKFIFIICMLLSGISPVHAQANRVPGAISKQLQVDGRQRDYMVYLPKQYTSSSKVPMIILLHGNKGTAASMLNIHEGSDFRTIAERENIVLVAPDGIEKSWNDGRPTEAYNQNVNDVHFIDTLITCMLKDYAVDSSRVYAAGMSNGGFMASRLGCDLGRRLAAIAAVAGTMGQEVPYPTCSPGIGMPAMYIHGTADPIIPFEGGTPKIGAGVAIASHQQVLDKWISLNGCKTTPVITTIPDNSHDGTTITKDVYSGGKNNSEVIGYTVTNGGHTWPGGKQYLPKFLIGVVSNNLNACEAIWAFFKEHQR